MKKRNNIFKFAGACVSERGFVRGTNQDSILLEILEGKKGNVAIGAVFDGVGGLERGELASGLLKAKFREWIDELEKRIDVSETEAETLYAHFKDEIEALNEELRKFMKKNRIDTGTTLSLILITKEEFFTLNVGDSRVYLLRDELIKLTNDDTVVREREGKYKRLLSNYMGKSDELSFSENYGEIRDGDVFLFCSDGFYHTLEIFDLTDIKSKNIKPEEIEKELLRIVKIMTDRGETDNISAGIIKVGF